MTAQAMAQTPGESNANSATGRFVLMDPLSGPSGSPLSGATSIGGNATFPGATGGLSTGIGFGPRNEQNSTNLTEGLATLGPDQISTATDGRNFIDDLVIGDRAPWQTDVPADSCMVYIGGGRSDAPSAGGVNAGIALANPYVTGTHLAGFGNGASRDGGAGPVFTGFSAKLVTAAAGVAAGAVIEAGWVNRNGGNMLAGQSTFGSAVAANPAAT